MLATGASTLTIRTEAQTARPPQSSRFGFDDVVRRATDLASVPFEGAVPPLPDELNKLGFDAWRQIEFRENKTLLGGGNGRFKLELFHLGHLYKRAVVINTIRDGIPAPIPYQTSEFTFGTTKFAKPLPVNLGFAGFKIRFPLNEPLKFDEFITFIGASYFRFLGRGQRYGLSARALTLGQGTNEEEFPFFREFWIETPRLEVDRLTIFGLLDSSVVTGAFQFECYPKANSVIDVKAMLIPRRDDGKTEATTAGGPKPETLKAQSSQPDASKPDPSKPDASKPDPSKPEGAKREAPKLGLAPLTSMFYIGENGPRFHDEFRAELHDSDGLMIHTGAGEWIWRPLRNPTLARETAFLDKDPSGFGLIQRDRIFSHYEDLDLAYQLRPSYWVEPKTSFGEGRVDLFEMPTTDETNDNIVASWIRKEPIVAGQPLTYSYSITAALDLDNLSSLGKTLNTFQTVARALGSSETSSPTTRRFIIDFNEGDLAYYESDPSQVQVVASTSTGKIIRAYTQYNPFTSGVRATFDVDVGPGQTADLRAFLKASQGALTETWTFSWEAPKA